MQMCPDCGLIYDESEYAHCPYCDGILDPDDDDEEYIDPDDIIEEADPGYDYVYDEYGNSVSCPFCNAEELRHNGVSCICIECDSTFSDQEIEDYAGPWHVG